MNVLALDFETTGTDPVIHQGIEVALIAVDADTLQEVEVYESRIQYDESRYEWTTGAQKIHGITTEALLGEKPQREVGREVSAFIAKHWPKATGSAPAFQERVILLGHNVEFDRQFLIQLLREGGDLYAAARFNHKVLDSMTIAGAMFNVWKSRDLFPLLGIHRNEAAHNALQDARGSLAAVRMARHAGDAAKGARSKQAIA